MANGALTNQDILEMRSYCSQSCYSYKLKASCKVLSKLNIIRKTLRGAWDNKKSLTAVIKDMLLLIWKHRAWIDAYNNPEFFIEDYFVERLYLKSRDVNDYPMLYEGIRAMAYASIPSNKKLHEINDKETCWKYMTKKGFPMPARLGHLYPAQNSLIWKTPNNESKTLQDLLNLHPLFSLNQRMACKAKTAIVFPQGTAPDIFSSTETQSQKESYYLKFQASYWLKK